MCDHEINWVNNRGRRKFRDEQGEQRVLFTINRDVLYRVDHGVCSLCIAIALEGGIPHDSVDHEVKCCPIFDRDEFIRIFEPSDDWLDEIDDYRSHDSDNDDDGDDDIGEEGDSDCDDDIGEGDDSDFDDDNHAGNDDDYADNDPDDRSDNHSGGDDSECVSDDGNDERECYDSSPSTVLPHTPFLVCNSDIPVISDDIAPLSSNYRSNHFPVLCGSVRSQKSICCNTEIPNSND